MNESKIAHQFSPEIAQSHGIPAAIVYEYLAWHRWTRQQPWVALTLTELCEQYPYLGEKQVRNALRKLIHPGRRTASLVARKFKDGVYQYSVNEDERAPDRTTHSFDVSVAAEVGLVPAIIYRNISYWIQFNWEQAAQELAKFIPIDTDNPDAHWIQAVENTRLAASHHNRISVWVDHHPYIPLRTVERSFADLVKTGWLVRKGKYRHKVRWVLPPKMERILESKMLNLDDLENSTAKRAASVPKGQSLRQKGMPVRQKGSQSAVSTNEDGPEVDSIEAVENHFQTPSVDCVAFRATSPLAGARVEVAGTATYGSADSASRKKSARKKRVKKSQPEFNVLEKIKLLNRPHYETVKKKVSKDYFGNPVDRPYIHRPTPDDGSEYDIYLETLPLAERAAYEAKFLPQLQAQAREQFGFKDTKEQTSGN